MIVIPMAGISRRFAEAGYQLPKYMLPLNGRSVFAHAVASFSSCFSSEAFLFAARDVAGTCDFIAAECAALGVHHYSIHKLSQPTAGQAETVEFALSDLGAAPDAPITIFNIDTFRPGFEFPRRSWWQNSRGYLEVFRGAGENWSYVKPQDGPEPLVIETAEKRPISDLCCTGLYHFARVSDFCEALVVERAKPSSPELYVAPLYNHLIATGLPIHYEIIPNEAVVFCGVPSEYEALLRGPVL
jgi:hypothetical protein